MGLSMDWPSHRAKHTSLSIGRWMYSSYSITIRDFWGDALLASLLVCGTAWVGTMPGRGHAGC